MKKNGIFASENSIFSGEIFEAMKNLPFLAEYREIRDLKHFFFRYKWHDKLFNI